MRKIGIALALITLILSFQNCSLETPTGNSPANKADQFSNSSVLTDSGQQGSNIIANPPPTPTPTPAPAPTPQPVANPIVVQAKDMTYNTAGTTTMSVPQYNTITVKIWGAGGGGGSVGGNGRNGGGSVVVSTKGTLSAGGGAGGGQAITLNPFNVSLQVRAGAGGTATGDGMNVTGRAGTLPLVQPVDEFTSIYRGGNGGAPLRSTLAAVQGGISTGNRAGRPATALGGGGSAAAGVVSNQPGGGGGGSGAYVERVYVYPELPVGSTLTITVGAGGQGGPTSTNGLLPEPAGGLGAVGQVEVSIR